VHALARHAIATSADRLVRHAPVARAGTDPEGVHQARVATRRLRSDLRTFRDALDGVDIDALRAELRWIGTALGRVRDADVLSAAVTRHAGALPAVDRPAIAGLLRLLARERSAAQASLRDALDSDRYAALVDRLTGTADTRPDVAGVPHAARHARDVARRPWRRLRHCVRALPATPSDEQLHEVRKRAKQARYALEAIEPVTGRRAARLAQRLARLQDLLGEQHDAIVASAWLRRTGLDATEPGVAFGAGMLAHAFLDDATAHRGAWRTAWHRVDHAARDVF
jgi:CHAD domain-containing protein